MRVDFHLTEHGLLQSLDNIIICPFSGVDGCPGTLIQTDTVGIIACNECEAEFELYQHGIGDAPVIPQRGNENGNNQG